MLIIGDIAAAFQLAEKNGWMSDLKTLLNPEAGVEHWSRLAECLEKELKFEESGDSHLHATQYEKAITSYIKAGPATLKKCIDIVHKTDKAVTKPLLDWILTLDDASLEINDVILIFDRLMFCEGIGKSSVVFPLTTAPAPESSSSVFRSVGKFPFGMAFKFWMTLPRILIVASGISNKLTVLRFCVTKSINETILMPAQTIWASG